MGRRQLIGARAIGIALLAGLALASAVPASAYERPERREFISVGDALVDPPVGDFASKPLWLSDITPDGRFVAFVSDEENLMDGDANLVRDVFVRDRKTGLVDTVSVSSEGVRANGNPLQSLGSDAPSISANGRYVSFVSWADNLVPGDTNQALDVFVHDRKSGDTRRISVSTAGAQANCTTSQINMPRYCAGVGTSISADGRYVVFTSPADNLVADDTNGVWDTFLHDSRTGRTKRVSVTARGEQGNGDSGGLNTGSAHQLHASVSDDGRFVAFTSKATNLVPDDTNAHPVFQSGADVFVHEIKTGKVERISLTSSGAQAEFGSLGNAPVSHLDSTNAISADGRYVVFLSDAANLAPTPPSAPQQGGAFMRDLRTKRTYRVSVDSNGRPFNAPLTPAISPDGRFVTMQLAAGSAPTQHPHYTRNGIYVYDIKTGESDYLSVPRERADDEVFGSQYAAGCSFAGGSAEYRGSAEAEPAISRGGRYISFVSCFAMDERDTNLNMDVYLADRGKDLGLGGLGGKPDDDSSVPDGICISDGICVPPEGVVAAGDPSGDASITDDADLIQARIAYRPQLKDMFFVAELANMPSFYLGGHGTFSTAGLPSTLYGFRFDVGIRSYEVRATSLSGGTFGLFDCTGSNPVCDEDAQLKGGFGTTGNQVVFSLPLKDIGVMKGAEISNVQAFSAIGGYLTGATEVLDRVNLR